MRYAVVAGVNKAGTTSLFVSLASHPGVVPAAIKETRHFLPARYGQPVAPLAEYEALWAGAPEDALRLEATPSYLYGGDRVARTIDGALDDVRILVILREPVARAISFFRYQKVRLRFPAELTFEEYLAAADRLGETDFDDPANEPYMAIRGGRYADFLPPWIDRFGSRLQILSLEELTAAPEATLARVATGLGIAPDGFPHGELSSENRTTGYRSGTLQRIALFGNDRFERFLRRHHGLKRRLRAFYYRVNGTPMPDEISPAVREELQERFAASNERLGALLDAHGFDRPPWLASAQRDVGIVDGHRVTARMPSDEPPDHEPVEHQPPHAEDTEQRQRRTSA